MLEKHFGAVTEAYLLAAKSSRFGGENEEFATYKEAATNEALSEEERRRASRIVEIASQMILRDRIPNLNYLVDKLELAARFES